MIRSRPWEFDEHGTFSAPKCDRTHARPQRQTFVIICGFGRRLTHSLSQPHSNFSEKNHPDIFLLVPRKRVLGSPALLLKVRLDVLPCGSRRIISPAMPHFLDNCRMVADATVPHAPGGLADQFIQSEMHV